MAEETDRSEDKPSTNMNQRIEDPVQEAMGNFGIWHIIIAVSVSFVKFPVAWHQLSIIFLAPPTDFYCISPLLSDHDNRHNLTYLKCEIELGNGTVEKCNKFEYNKTVFQSSIITEWDLVCDRNQLANIVQMVTMFGILLGNLIFGMVADRIGRKPPLVIAVILQCIAGLASAYSPWYELFLLLKFIGALATGGTMLTSFVLLMEIVGVEWRPICSVLFHVPFIVGHIIMSLISYYTRTWNDFLIAVSLPPIILLSYYWIIPESPRWLLAVGKIDKAREVLRQAGERNKIDVQKLDDAVGSYKVPKNIVKYDVTHLFRTPVLRMRTLYICVNWLTCGICFFGIAHYVGKLNGNIFINVAISAGMELPGTVLVVFLISRVSRLKILIGAHMVTGISLLLITITSNPIARVCLASIGQFGMSISFPTVYLYSSEVFPTVVRSAGLGLTSLCARLGSMIAPYIASMEYIQLWLPASIFGIVPLIGAGLCFLLPETMGCDLPETVMDGENFGNKKKIPSTQERYTLNNMN